MKLGDLGEFGLIARIATRVENVPGVITGIGDDAAVTNLTPGMQILTSTDMLLEDVHFRRAWHDPYRLGRKSLAVSISDIAAMGGIPRWALLSIALPGDLPLDFIDAFTNGFLAMAAEHNVALIGGDTCRSHKGLIISVTIMGEQVPERIVRRSGARAGDEIWVTGTLGDAALALTLLEDKKNHSPEGDDSVGGGVAHDLLSRLLDPTPRTAAGTVLAESGMVTAMIDISDGLLADFSHIAELSNSGGCLYLESLPLSASFRATFNDLSLLPYHLALAGGEDYELAFTADPGNREKIIELMKTCGIAVTPVGIVTNSSGVIVLNSDGTRYSSESTGFTHFE